MEQAVDSHLHRLLQWQQGESRGPMKITLFPTNICNIECKHCWQRWADYDKTYKSELSDERLLHLVDEAADMGVKDWYFVGGGDAMGRGKLVIEMCERIRAHGMNGAIHTNGTLFRPWMFDKLIDIEWARILVSLDGPNAEINDYIRSRGFKKATDNLRQFAEKKRERNATLPHTSIYVTLTNLTFDKVDQFVDLARDVGCDEGVFISGLIIESEGSAQFELTPEQKACLPDHLRRAIRRADELEIPNNFQDYMNNELLVDGMNMHRGYRHKRRAGIAGAMCYEPWTSMSVLPDGRIGPCCAFYDEAAISIKEKSLEEVWNGEYMTAVRRGMIDGNPPDYCKRCPSNLYVQKERMRRIYSEALVWNEVGPRERFKLLIAKGLHSVREHGLVSAVRRGLEWRRIQSQV